MLTTSERVILQNELTNDPLSRGYASLNNSDVVVSLKTVNRSRIRARMEASEIFQAISIAEFTALTDVQQRNIMAMLGFGSLNPQGREADLFVAYFGAGSATITALATARMEAISRAVELGIPNVYEMDVQAVRGG